MSPGSMLVVSIVVIIGLFAAAVLCLFAGTRVLAPESDREDGMDAILGEGGEWDGDGR